MIKESKIYGGTDLGLFGVKFERICINSHILLFIFLSEYEDDVTQCDRGTWPPFLGQMAMGLR